MCWYSRFSPFSRSTYFCLSCLLMQWVSTAICLLTLVLSASSLPAWSSGVSNVLCSPILIDRLFRHTLCCSGVSLVLLHATLILSVSISCSTYLLTNLFIEYIWYTQINNIESNINLRCAWQTDKRHFTHYVRLAYTR